MRRIDWAWAYWASFWLSLAATASLLLSAGVRLQRAFDQDALTRATLVDVLMLGLGALAMLLVAGWAVAYRPREEPATKAGGLWD